MSYGRSARTPKLRGREDLRHYLTHDQHLVPQHHESYSACSGSMARLTPHRTFKFSFKLLMAGVRTLGHEVRPEPPSQ